MEKGHIKISGNISRLDTMKIKGIVPGGGEIDLGCYKFEIKADIRKYIIGEVVLYCRNVDLDVEGDAEIKGENDGR